MTMEVAVHDIGHHFNGNAVLSGITYAFAENEVTAILGKSGSGKTTLLQILNGMIKWYCNKKMDIKLSC